MGIRNAMVTKEESFFKIVPTYGYKLRKKGDDTVSYEEVDVPLAFESEISNYHSVTNETPDEPIIDEKEE